MTGVAKHVDKVYRDAEQMGVLASDDTLMTYLTLN